MRFLVDMNLATEVAAWLRTQGHDAAHLQELGLRELDDRAVFAKASAERRVVRPRFRGHRGRGGRGAVAVILFRLRSAQTTRVIDRSKRSWHPPARRWRRAPPSSSLSRQG